MRVRETGMVHVCGTGINGGLDALMMDTHLAVHYVRRRGRAGGARRYPA